MRKIIIAFLLCFTVIGCWIERTTSSDVSSNESVPSENITRSPFETTTLPNKFIAYNLRDINLSGHWDTVYRSIYKSVLMCVGDNVLPNRAYNDINWHVADEIHLVEYPTMRPIKKDYIGFFTKPSTIVIREDNFTKIETVYHEILHYLLHPEHKHGSEVFCKCDPYLIECDD